jgi:peptidoglycan/xylan/chitin deacetylase (PgdA/CDA1 family)
MSWHVHPPALLRNLHTDRLWRVATTEKKIYLTFDDGPIPDATHQVLDILKEHDALATFFCVGANIEKHPDVYQRILAEGHATGNHTWSHMNGWKSDSRKYYDDVERCAAVCDSKLFRPPYGRIKPSQSRYLRSLGYKLVMWDVLSCDFDPHLSETDCLTNVLRYTREGSVVVFHDSEKAKAKMLFALPLMLEHFRAKGFMFDRLLC